MIAKYLEPTKDAIKDEFVFIFHSVQQEPPKINKQGLAQIRIQTTGSEKQLRIMCQRKDLQGNIKVLRVRTNIEIQ